MTEPLPEQKIRRLEQENADLRVQAEAARRQVMDAHQMASIGRLLAGIVHEINSPIGSIFSNNEVTLRSLEMLRNLLEKRDPASLEKAARIVDICQSLASVDKIACERISSVIRGLKTFARVDSSELRKVDLNEHLRNTLKLTRAEFRRRIEVETSFGDLPPVECYPQMLNQVFLNILVNAGQAIQGQGRICLQTCCEGDAVRVSISDNGCGMTPEQAGRIFEAGFTTKPEGEGTGLGLAIVREIVEEKHGGSIAVQSAPGKGTTFDIRIPVRHANTAAG